ncbi:MAG: hypothetical protein WCW14_04685 [Candidatus Paceibacterota bacterium]
MADEPTLRIDILDSCGLDLTIDQIVAEKFRVQARDNRAVLVQTNEEIACIQNYWASLPEDDEDGEEISIPQYIASHPELLEEYRTFSRRDIHGRESEQKVRRNTCNEQQLLSQMRVICEGQFAEVIVVIAVLEDGTQIKMFAFSANGAGVSEEDMNMSLKMLQDEISHRKTLKIFLVHTHPDQLAKSKVKSTYTGPVIGFISNNALTDNDIKIADRISLQFFPEIPLCMIAVSENGLTYEYDSAVQS